MNYTQLVNSIQAYTENSFPDTVGLTTTEQINTFITNAEIRIYNSVQMPQFKKNVQGLLTSGNQYLSLPLDFKAAYSLAVYTDVAAGLNSAQLFLLDKDVNFMREVYPSPADTGLPQYYALFGTNLSSTSLPNPLMLSAIVAPTPDANYRVELHYYYYPESITVATSGQSWLGDNFETALLYGSLLEAYTFMKGEPDTIAQYQKRYDEALMQLKRLGDGMDRRDSYRNGQVSNPVN
jgi:hypothetical protein